MFKTKEQIESEADFLYGEDAKNGDSWKYHTYIAVYTQAQQDIKEACSEWFEECFKNGRNGNGETPSQIEVWQACALFHKAKIDTLKQRELGYQSDLRQKDAEIDRLKKKISSFDAYASADEKYQEAVEDIEYLTFKIKGHLTLDALEELNDKIRTKYGLDKKEG